MFPMMKCNTPVVFCRDAASCNDAPSTMLHCGVCWCFWDHTHFLLLLGRTRNSPSVTSSNTVLTKSSVFCSKRLLIHGNALSCTSRVLNTPEIDITANSHQLHPLPHERTQPFISVGKGTHQQTVFYCPCRARHAPGGRTYTSWRVYNRTNKGL